MTAAVACVARVERCRQSTVTPIHHEAALRQGSRDTGEDAPSHASFAFSKVPTPAISSPGTPANDQG